MKNTRTAWVLWLLTGYVGGHRYYLGKSKAGLMTVTLGGLGLWWLSDAPRLSGWVRAANDLQVEAQRRDERSKVAAAAQAQRWSRVNTAYLDVRAIAAVDEQAADDEMVEAVIPGASSQAIIATSQRVYVYKPGSMAGAMGGHKLITWEYRAIYGVQLEIGRLTGAVILQTPGSKGTDTSYWSNDADAPAKAAYAIPVVKNDNVTEGVKQLRTVVASHQ